MTKKKINYINGNIPENISEILANSDEQDLKILTLLFYFFRNTNLEQAFG